jgi:DNA-binding SARP family transcriptional activator
MNGNSVLVRLLGPVDITIDGVARPLPGLRRKTVLAVLGLHPGEAVSASRLIDIVWGDRPPTTVANTLQSHMSYLRTVLGARDVIVARPPGYLLDLPATATDVAQAEAARRDSAQLADPAQRAARLAAALRLWRGPALSDVGGGAWLHEQATRLERLRQELVQSLVEARIALGEHASVLPELQDLAERHPFREQVHRQLMIALYRSGRRAEALDTYHRLRQRISDELGIDPSPGLRQLEAAILRRDPSLDPPPTATRPPTNGHLVANGHPAANGPAVTNSQSIANSQSATNGHPVNGARPVSGPASALLAGHHGQDDHGHDDPEGAADDHAAATGALAPAAGDLYHVGVGRVVTDGHGGTDAE